MCVCVCIKTVPSFTANTTSGWTRTLYNSSYVYVVRSHSMSVDLISHFTPQKIFNKSKKRKEEQNDRRASVSVLCNWVLHRKLVPKFLRVHWRNFGLWIFFTLLVFKRYRTPCRCQFSAVMSPTPTGNSLVQIHKNRGGRSAGEGWPLQEGLHLYNGRKRRNQAGFQHLAPANKLPANAKSSHTSVP